MLAIFVALLSVLSPVVLSGGSEGPSEYQVKAAFLLNFARFVEWPASGAQASEPFVVVVFGKDPFGPVLDQAMAGKTVNGRPLQVRRVTDPAALRTCQMAFIAASESRRSGEILAALSGSAVLTVSESGGFARRGGMINFVVDENHVRFEINPGSATRAGLKVSSKLLQLAIVVRDGSEGK